MIATPSVLGEDTEGPANDLSGLKALVVCEHVDVAVTGGAERVALEVARRLADRGARIEIVTSRPAIDGVQHEVISGVPISVLPAVDLRRYLRMQVQWPKGVSKVVEELMNRVRPDVVHVHTPFFLSSPITARLAHRRGIPVVSHFHVGSLGELPLIQRFPARLFELTVARRLLNKSSAVIAVSEDVRRHCQSLSGAHLPLVVAPNGVDHAKFAIDTTSQEATDPDRCATHRPPEILYVGRLIGNKGPDLLVEAAHRLHDDGLDFKVVFVGDGPEVNNLRRAAESGSARDRIHFMGAVDDVETYLRSASVVVRPSFTEGMPLAVLEAMSAGCCVVASDIPGTAELIRHENEGLLFPAGDTMAFAAALRRVLLDPELRSRLGTVAQVRSLEFSWEATTEKVLDAYRMAGVEW